MIVKPRPEPELEPNRAPITDGCYICGCHDTQQLFQTTAGRLMCRDRVDCYQRARHGRQ